MADIRLPGGGASGQVTLAGGSQLDAFGRLRVADLDTLFDSKQLWDNAPLFWDDQQVSGAGTGSTHNPNEAMSRMTVGNATAGTRIRQTFMRFNYQPGKGQLVKMTLVLDGSGGGTGITRRVGYFDDDNGLFIEDLEGVVRFVRRTKTSGAVVDNPTALPLTYSDGTTIDWSKTQILVIDFEWLSVGIVRMGLMRGGVIDYIHTEDGANVLALPYMSTPNLPLRYEISNDGSGVASELCHICSSVESEAGQENLGAIFHKGTRGTHVDADVDGTLYAIVGLRLKTTHLDSVIKIFAASIAELAGNKNCEWILIHNPTVAGTFTYTDIANTSVQSALGATANTITGGVHIGGGHFSSGTKGGSDAGVIPNVLRLGAAIDGTRDTVVLCSGPIGVGTADIEGALRWQELS